MSTDSVYVYRLFDADHELLYIGCTNNVERRVTQHLRKNTGGGEEIADYTVEEYPNRSAGLAAEARAIEAEQPRINVNGKRRKGVSLHEVGNPDGSFGEVLTWRIAQRMLERGVGVVQLARDCGIPHTRLSRSLGLSNFRMDDLYAVAAELEVSVTALITVDAA